MTRKGLQLINHVLKCMKNMVSRTKYKVVDYHTETEVTMSIDSIYQSYSIALQRATGHE